MKMSIDILFEEGQAGKKRVTLFIVLILSLLAVVSYWGVLGNDFINYDDPAYVTGNRYVEKGLTVGGLVWAFTTTSVSNWHPLTWVSLMVDRELYGMQAGGYHWTSVILHVLSGWVLFLVHPLHVESVAWVAERKDVLSGLFWMLGLWGYARYVERPGYVRYGWVVFFFVLGLLSKPMVVTFPFVLLLMDWWPLGRVAGRREFFGLVYEKVPLFLLSGIGSVITFMVQRGTAVTPLEVLPFGDRVANALVSYARYVVKMVWPVDLAVFYPHPGSWPFGEVLLAVALIAVVTLLAVMQVRRRPYLLVGWFWYLGVLVPVIGLVQVGSQAMADRYTYLPLIGIFIMVVWVLADVWGAGLFGRAMAGIGVPAAMVVLVLATQIQVGYWRDSSTLFSHALNVTERNCQAHDGLGKALVAQEDFSGALAHYREAIRLCPSYAAAFNNLAVAQMKQGNLDDALSSNADALRLSPHDGDIHFNRAEIFARKGMGDAAIQEYHSAAAKKPDDVQVRNNLGVALIRQGRYDEAIAEFAAVAQNLVLE